MRTCFHDANHAECSLNYNNNNNNNMMLFSQKTFLVLSTLTFTAVHGLDIPNMDVVMRGGDIVEEMDWADFPTFRNGTCTVRFPRDGNWATQNGFFTGGWDANQKSACQGDGPSKVKYHLQRDGNFVARCGYNVDYATRTGQGRPGDYFLGIDDACILHLYKGWLACDSIDIQEEIWTNIRLKPLQRGDRLGQGEQVRHAGTTMVMQSSDGNLVLYGPSVHDRALWAANENWAAPPPSNLDEYYARVTPNGWLLLVGQDLWDGSETVYYRKNLHTDGATCFTVEYDATRDDIVAVSCDGRRDRQLRGSVNDEKE
jgi:hypothetical protein